MATAGQAGHEVDAGDPVLEFRSVSKIFPDGTHAVDGVSLQLRRGEFVSVVGPSGCGKSTLLKLASGLLPHSGGEIEVDPKHLGYVFQDPTLLPWRTVQENGELFLELRGIARAERRERARKAIETVGLSSFADHLPAALSGGMKMRVSVARSLAVEPAVFLFDEPFGALDAITRDRLNDELIDLFVRQRFAGLFITHSIFEAVFLSTRVLVMSARPGRVVAEFDVPFPYPRSNDLRFDPDFAELSSKVSDALKGAYS